MAGSHRMVGGHAANQPPFARTLHTTRCTNDMYHTLHQCCTNDALCPARE